STTISTDTQPISVTPTATAASGATGARRSVIAAAISGATPIRVERMTPGTRRERALDCLGACWISRAIDGTLRPQANLKQVPSGLYYVRLMAPASILYV